MGNPFAQETKLPSIRVLQLLYKGLPIDVTIFVYLQPRRASQVLSHVWPLIPANQQYMQQDHTLDQVTY